MNNLTITGNLVYDPKLRQIGEQAVCEMRVAVDNGERPTTYIDVKTFEAGAEACAQYLRKGRKVGVSGRLLLEEWERDGQRQRRYVVAGRVEFLDQPASGAGESSAEPEPGSEPGARAEAAFP